MAVGADTPAVNLSTAEEVVVQVAMVVAAVMRAAAVAASSTAAASQSRGLVGEMMLYHPEVEAAEAGRSSRLVMSALVTSGFAREARECFPAIKLLIMQRL